MKKDRDQGKTVRRNKITRILENRNINTKTNNVLITDEQGTYQLQLTLKSLNTRPPKLSPRGRHLRIRHMIINELSEMGDPARDQDAVDFRQDLGPGDGDGGLHVAHVD